LDYELTQAAAKKCFTLIGTSCTIGDKNFGAA
jgi:hypothetical protein